MNNNNKSTKIIAYVFILLHTLTGCVTTGGGNSASKSGPKLSSSYEQEEMANTITSTAPKLDVIIPIFDPGLSEKAKNYEEEGVWPELRRAEANRFAYKLKQALDNTHEFGAVRVTPDKTASGDLYVIGQIKDSDGIDVKFKLTVEDISGKKWIDDTFTHEVEASFYKNSRNSGKDPYDPVFKEAADEIINALKDHNSSELDDLKYIADMRFGASFNDTAFLEHMNTEGKYTKLISKPSDNDPLFQRVTAIRVREQLFIDNLQPNYSSFAQTMDSSYLAWQDASFTETKLRKAAQVESILKTVGGIALFALAVAAAAGGGGNDYNSNFAQSAEIVAVGVAGAMLVSSGFKSKEEADLHQDTINELGESINLELEPQVISFEDQTVELTGNIQEQFMQWRTFLKRIYELESTPNVAL